MVKSLPASLRALSRNGAHADARLFVFPYAGGGAYQYRTWPEGLEPNVEVIGVQMPGREDRVHEAPMANLDAALDPVVADMTSVLDDRPFAVFGHSLGALLCMEAVQRISETSTRTPEHVFVSGCRAPQIIHRGRIPISELDDAGLIDHLRRLGGTPDEVLENPDVAAYLLRLVRADYTLFDNYEYRARPPLERPITVFGGDEDPSTTAESLNAWAGLTNASTTIHTVPGGHFFVHSARRALLSVIANVLRPAGAANRTAPSAPAAR